MNAKKMNVIEMNAIELNIIEIMRLGMSISNRKSACIGVVHLYKCVSRLVLVR